MTINEIEKIIIDTNADEWTKPAKEIYKLHLEVQIQLIYDYGYLGESATKKLKELQQELKTLENE